MSCNNCPNTQAAAQNGHLDCLMYLHEKGCSWDRFTCIWAAANGHLDCLKYAHEKGYPWNRFTCAWAAKNGHLDCLMYLHEKGCSWDRFTCAWAAKNGHLDCLKYAHEKGCPLDRLTCNEATRNSHLDCLKYAHENDCLCKHQKPKTCYSVDLDVVSDNSSNECCVCLNNKNKVQFLPCNHMCCVSCSNRLFEQNSTCPYCRGEIKNSVLINQV